MLKRYVYKNANNRTINISGYQFKEGQELESDVLINGFNEAVSNGFLELIEWKPENLGSNTTQALQAGDTSKVKVVFHLIFNDTDIVRKVEVDPGVLVEFPSNKISDSENVKGWFKDAEFTKPVANIDKVKAPKKGEVHFYGRYYSLKSSNPSEPSKWEDVTDSKQETDQIIPPSNNELTPSENDPRK
jgi:hypothetical protein